MGKIKSILKTLIFIWGIATLALVLFVTITLSIKSVMSRKTVESDQKKAYEKRFDQIVLTVREATDKNKTTQLINISKSGKQLVRDYRLPVEKFGLEFPIQVKDSLVIPTDENDFRVILYTRYYECAEESTDYVWFFKKSDKLNLVHVADLSELTKSEGSGVSFFGYKHVNLPYFENAEFRHWIIPIEVNVGDTIRIFPLLNKTGIDLLKMAYQTEAEKRMAILSKTQNAKMLEEYKAALTKFEDAITEKTLPY